ncbi:hypothetical protein [Mycolicibacterium phlei]
MDKPTESQVLIDTGGLIVTDDGRRVLVIDRGTGGWTVLAFVLGVLTLAIGGFGLFALFTGELSSVLGAVFVAVGVALAVVTALAVRRVRRYRGRPLHECRPAAVLDRKLELFSYRGGALVQLDQVRFARRFQIGSSSPKLVAVTPGGTHVLKRGNPFDGGVANVDEVLNAVVRAHVHTG